MKKNLVIVESPTKAKTIKNFLGAEYTIMSSMGHIRDLPKKVLGVDIKNGFKSSYGVIPAKKKLVAKLKEAYKDSDLVYLATDGDREGEGIAWHVKELLKIPDAKTRRTVFHEITAEAIKQAFKKPVKLNMDLVKAYRVRRALDRVVGYKISPILWKKIASGLSAGRVQSPALKLIVEKEKEIRAFNPVTYWKVAADFEAFGSTLRADLVKAKGEDIKDERVSDESILKDIEKLKGEVFSVKKNALTEKKLSPPMPFTTSTLQQQANTVLGFSSRRTMIVAQQLYEGIDLPEGRTGLITYMRTDSVAVAKQAQTEARKLVESRYGKSFLPEKSPIYKTKSAHSQEAHEAIRPVKVAILPEDIEDNLSGEQFKLYHLIWQRFVASQMNQALSVTRSIRLEKGSYAFKAVASVLKDDGFLALYSERIAADREARGLVQFMEKLAVGSSALLKEIETSEHQTLPPPHYNEASLVKTLEAKGIGRPSTYVSIIETLLRRKYVVRNKRQLLLQDIGEVVSDVLEKHFPMITDYEFTSKLESMLDDVADAKIGEREVLEKFYKKFEVLLEKAKTDMETLKKVTDRKCPWCGTNLVEKYSANGKFLYCGAGYKACVYRVYFSEEGELLPEKKFCPKCGKPMVLRVARRGPFYACSGFPSCKSIVSYGEEKKTAESEPDESD
ncbi:MAG: type I DNA topoisomerase [Elusimicrobia bacterium CG03_land_8_20_14_0_80_50_18]|nr:MAG: type I DNA topoisomerase [Elusimicrobia bacterium CG03_land_8_20_14_0_80_50_18]PIX15477.1 MAG: type I DNA topoisomerase [Elusimicrobia bacterium CG_4_8_14_3_um_filter_50_9]